MIGFGLGGHAAQGVRVNVAESDCNNLRARRLRDVRRSEGSGVVPTDRLHSISHQHDHLWNSCASVCPHGHTLPQLQATRDECSRSNGRRSVDGGADGAQVRSQGGEHVGRGFKFDIGDLRSDRAQHEVSYECTGKVEDKTTGAAHAAGVVDDHDEVHLVVAGRRGCWRGWLRGRRRWRIRHDDPAELHRVNLLVPVSLRVDSGGVHRPHSVRHHDLQR